MQFVNYFLRFFFRWMSYSARWANVFAAATEDNALVWLDNGFLFTIDCLDFEGLHVAEFGAFAAGCAFGVVYFWVPRYFVTGNSVILTFWHFLYHRKQYS
jgi:hypothetical protein